MLDVEIVDYAEVERAAAISAEMGLFRSKTRLIPNSLRMPNRVQPVLSHNR